LRLLIDAVRKVLNLADFPCRGVDMICIMSHLPAGRTGGSRQTGGGSVPIILPCSCITAAVVAVPRGTGCKKTCHPNQTPSARQPQGRPGNCPEAVASVRAYFV